LNDETSSPIVHRLLVGFR